MPERACFNKRSDGPHRAGLRGVCGAFGRRLEARKAAEIEYVLASRKSELRASACAAAREQCQQ
jgi:hypothetical protein